MIRRSFRWGLFLGLLGGLAFVVVRSMQDRREPVTPYVAPTPTAAPPPPPPPPSPPAPPPAPVKKAAAKKAAAKAKPKSAPWIEPVEGTCPDSHPVKAKLSSGIFHLPGGFAYPRTKPDRCYCDAEAAGADGLRPAKR